MYPQEDFERIRVRITILTQYLTILFYVCGIGKLLSFIANEDYTKSIETNDLTEEKHRTQYSEYQVVTMDDLKTLFSFLNFNEIRMFYSYPINSFGQKNLADSISKFWQKKLNLPKLHSGYFG